MAKIISDLPINSLVKFGKHQVNTETAQDIVWMIADKNHTGYPSNSVTLIAQKIIDLRAYDAIEIDDEEERVKYATANYEYSNIHQWLNSDATASKWYVKAHSQDEFPSGSKTVTNGTQYYNRAGFLYNFSTEEKLALLPTTIVTQTGSDVSKSVVDKVFLPSLWEILGTHTYADGSTKLACFVNSEVRCSLTSQAFTNSLSASKPSTASAYWQYMTRSTTSTRDISHITSNGTASNYIDPWDGSLGLRPVINLSSSLKVSATTDSDGCYTIAYNKVPTISGTDGDLGTPTDGFTHSYTVNDVDDEVVTVTEYLDNILVRSYVASLGETNTFDVTGKTWLLLPNGVHTLKIVATDGFGESVRTHTFTKNMTSFVVQRATPFESTTQPKCIIVTVVKNIPTEAIFKVEACNNGFDASPTWEDITLDVTRGEIYDFTNTTKTASKWGVNIRVTVDRNGAAGACYITEIGGNFE